MKRLGWIVLLAACGAPAKNGGVDNTAPEVGGGPAPTVGWKTEGEGGYGSFTTERLPAVSTDGAQVVFAHEGEDGGRGYPNLTLVVKDAADQAVRTQPVMSADQNGDMEPVAPTQTQLDAGNAFLAEGAWNAMTAAGEPVGSDPEQGPVFSESATVTVGSVSIEFNNSGHVIVRDGGQVVHES